MNSQNANTIVFTTSASENGGRDKAEIGRRVRYVDLTARDEGNNILEMNEKIT